MTTDYVGSVVSVKLVSGGSIQGKVTKITADSLSLTDLNDGKSRQRKACLQLQDISDVDIVSMPTVENSREPKAITIMRRPGSPNQRKSPVPAKSDLVQEPVKRKPFKKDEAFSEPTINMTADFDFESSNKLFQKDAIFDEWRQKDGCLPKRDTDKMAPSEMVIEHNGPATGPNFQGHFVSDDQIPVTGVTLSKRIALFKRVISSGLSYSHAVSVAGMSISQMVIQVIGGSCRINAQNHNKPPVVVVLVSSGECGKVALTTALHLHQHGLNVRVAVMSPPNGCDGLLNILSKSQCVNKNGLHGLPTVIDIIIDGTQDRNTLLSWPEWLDPLIQWTAQSTAPILAIDPQHPNQLTKTPTAPKWACALGAPLLSQGKSGRLFLVDIGLSPSAFQDEGIPYRSPFFDKFVIPLHRTVE